MMRRVLRKEQIPLIAATVLGISFLIFSYYNYFVFQYASAPGGDLYNHGLMVREIQEKGLGTFFVGYPKLFHLLVVLVAGIAGKSILASMLLMVPIVVVGAAFVLFVLLQKITNSAIGLLGFITSLLVSRQPLQTLYDGGFPSYIAVAMWLPLFILGVYCIERVDKKKGVWVAGMAGVLLLLTHHFSVVYALLFSVCFLPFATKKVKQWTVLGVLICLMLYFTPVASGLRGLVSTLIAVQGEFPWFSLIGSLDNPNAIIRFADFPSYFTPPIFWAGLLTALTVLIPGVLQNISKSVKAAALLTLVLLLISQVEALRFPLRIARDAGVLLTFFSVYGVYLVLQKLKYSAVAQKIIVVAVVISILPYISQRIQRLSTFEPTMQYTRSQEVLASKTGFEPTIGLDLLLPSIDHYNIRPYLPQGVIGDGERDQFASARYILMIESGGEKQRTYEQELELLGFTIAGREVDEGFATRLYRRQKP